MTASPVVLVVSGSSVVVVRGRTLAGGEVGVGCSAVVAVWLAGGVVVGTVVTGASVVTVSGDARACGVYARACGVGTLCVGGVCHHERVCRGGGACELILVAGRR